MTMGLLFPMVSSLVHTVHEHELQICQAQDESHIHSQATDCKHEHYFNSFGVSDPIDPPGLPTVYVYNSSAVGQVCTEKTNFHKTLKLRGPPAIDV